jgi:hypothetical protein
MRPVVGRSCSVSLAIIEVVALIFDVVSGRGAAMGAAALLRAAVAHCAACAAPPRRRRTTRRRLTAIEDGRVAGGFELLALASRTSHRKLHAVAEEIVATGDMSTARQA